MEFQKTALRIAKTVVLHARKKEQAMNKIEKISKKPHRTNKRVLSHTFVFCHRYFFDTFIAF